jgi:hypothetical protein
MKGPIAFVVGAAICCGSSAVLDAQNATPDFSGVYYPMHAAGARAAPARLPVLRVHAPAARRRGRHSQPRSRTGRRAGHPTRRR